MSTAPRDPVNYAGYALRLRGMPSRRAKVDVLRDAAGRVDGRLRSALLDLADSVGLRIDDDSDWSRARKVFLEVAGRPCDARGFWP